MEMQSAFSQLWFSGFYCAQRNRSTICGQLDEKTPASERSNTQVPQYSQLYVLLYYYLLKYQYILNVINNIQVRATVIQHVYTSAPQF